VNHDVEAELSPAAARLAARAELRQSLGWAALGAAILIASLRMDRLESQGIDPHTVPGLLPGLLGIVMLLLAGLLALRSWRRGALAADLSQAPAFDAAVVLVGHGLPFWAAAALFVSVAIMSLQAPLRRAASRRLGLRDIAIAIVIGLAAGGAITLVFQQIFLVRLP
jgi:hypothetical protein